MFLIILFVALVVMAIALLNQSFHMTRERRRMDWLTSIAIYSFLKENGPEGTVVIEKSFMDEVGDDIYKYEFVPEFIDNYGIRVRLFR